MSRVIASLLSALLLAGCGVAGANEPPSPKLYDKAPRPPAECVTGSPEWEPMPDRDVDYDELKRIWKLNRSRFNDMRGDRRVCRAGLLGKGV